MSLAPLTAFGIQPPRHRAQEEAPDASTRRLWDEGLIKKRPPPTTKPRQRQYKYATAPLPKPQPANHGSKKTSPEPDTPRMLGVTLWRLRNAVAGDSARLLVQSESNQKQAELTPERTALETPFKEGEYVRLSIEAPDTGYLYVIDREKYTDGSLSDPYLIFPTLRMRNGNHQVTAGRVIEFPAQDDMPPYFTVTKSRPDQVGEVLTLIVSPNPLDLKIGRNYIPLDKAQVAEWEQKWGAPFERLDQAGSEGKAWTKAEQEAGQNEKKLLKQDDEAPQCIFCVAAKPGDPLLVKLTLQYTSAKKEK